MKSLTLLWCIVVLCVSLHLVESGTSPLDFLKQTYQGSKDMYKAYKDMKKANFKGADKYFHARGNHDAAKRGPGGAWVAEKLSKARKMWQSKVSGRSALDSKADQVANKWGRSGKDPNFFRPSGLPKKY